jgi:hypothetical protein
MEVILPKKICDVNSKISTKILDKDGVKKVKYQNYNFTITSNKPSEQAINNFNRELTKLFFKYRNLDVIPYN